MCITCGCNSTDEPAKATMPGKPAELIINPEPKGHLHQLEIDVLHKNNHAANHNREHFRNKNILAFNFVSSPGSGKTTLLEHTIKMLQEDILFYVIEGDQQTMQDAERIKATGAEVVQINTGKGCHLDASMVHKALHQMEPKENSLLIIENVGNLVCPALFDLGEKYRVVVMSVTEGEDKPLKYPDMYESAHICIINKIDLLPYVDFNKDRAMEYALRVNPHLKFFEMSATKGDGMDIWGSWLLEKVGRIKVRS